MTKMSGSSGHGNYNGFKSAITRHNKVRGGIRKSEVGTNSEIETRKFSRKPSYCALQQPLPRAHPLAHSAEFKAMPNRGPYFQRGTIRLCRLTAAFSIEANRRMQDRVLLTRVQALTHPVGVVQFWDPTLLFPRPKMDHPPCSLN
jgi:hypothetical protein